MINKIEGKHIFIIICVFSLPLFAGCRPEDDSIAFALQAEAETIALDCIFEDGEAGYTLVCSENAPPTAVPTNTPEPEPATPTAIPTVTAVPPTHTPTPTITPTITPTATIAPTAVPTGTVEAYYWRMVDDVRIYAAECTDEQHDKGYWHGNWNEVEGCYYDHQHGDDPSAADAVFGHAYSVNGDGHHFGGVHQTPNELALKDTGYQITVELVPSLHQAQNSNPILAYRATHHWVPGLHGMFQDIHSVHIEALVENGDGSTGIIYTGGWLNFGCYDLVYKNPNDTRAEIQPGDEPENNCENDDPTITPYRAYGSAGNGDNVNNGQSYWNSATVGGYGRIVNSFDIFHSDTPLHPVVFTPSGRDGSSWFVYDIRLKIDGQFTPYLVDGKVFFDGYVDKFGAINTSCTTAVAETCIPTLVDNVELNDYTFDRGVINWGDGINTVVHHHSQVEEFGSYYDPVDGSICENKSKWYPGVLFDPSLHGQGAVDPTCLQTDWFELRDPGFTPQWTDENGVSCTPEYPYDNSETCRYLVTP